MIGNRKLNILKIGKKKNRNQILLLIKGPDLDFAVLLPFYFAQDKKNFIKVINVELLLLCSIEYIGFCIKRADMYRIVPRQLILE